jgi:hypothetical protein
MPLNASGPISLAGSTVGQSIALEISQGATAQISLNDAAVRTLAGVASGAITMPTNFHGKSSSSGLSGTISYSIGAAGTSGPGAVNGGTGGATTITYTPSSVSLTANGGSGGVYQGTEGGAIAGGTATGGTTNTTGGTGRGSTGDSGGGGGGGIGGANATTAGFNAGDPGAQSLDVAGLFAVLTAAGQATTSGGAGGDGGSSPPKPGFAATGFGCGGGGAGWYGGNGGAGRFGGGGGGASGLGSNWTGGLGGAGGVAYIAI